MPALARFGGLTLLATLMLVGPTQAQAAPGYTFTVIADSSAMHLNPASFGCPAINDRGDVVLRADSAGGVNLLWEVTAGGVVVPIANTGGALSSIDHNPSINNLGQVSFGAGFDSGAQAILRAEGSQLTAIADTSGPFAFLNSDTSINDLGRVAFKAELDDSDRGLFSGTGGSIATTYLASSSPFAGDNSAPSINGKDQIAFLDSLDTGAQGVFRARGHSARPIALQGGPLAGLFVPSLNSGGTAAFTGLLTAGGEAVLAGNGRALRTIADTDGRFQSFGDPSLSDTNGVAFMATLDSGQDGIFTGPNPAEVIETGDPLDGSTVLGMTFCREGLNGGGQVTFDAQLLDGRTVAVRATPA